MTRRILALAMPLAILLSALVPSFTLAAIPLPSSMAAVGDSITRAASTDGSLGVDAPQNSWSTGTSNVNSHYQRLLALGAPISGQNHNHAVSGAKMANLPGQMQGVVPLQPGYVTVLMGGNDLCTDTTGGMTSATAYGDQFKQAMAILTAGSPNTYVYVVSVPNVHQLYDLFKGDWFARFIWGFADICQSLLANPTSTDQADVDRREMVRQRNIAYNAQLAEVCAQYDHCRFDGNRAFNTPFTTNDVSGDYFHPSVAGQAKLASISFAAGYAWGSAPPPSPPPNQAPVADFNVACVDLGCTFTDDSTDDAGIVSRAWQFGDGGTSTATDPGHAYAAAGAYTVTLRVTDAAGASDTVSKPVSVTAPTTPTMWVEDLAASADSRRSSWWATVSVLVAGPDGRGVSGATVSGTWDPGGAGSCVTGSDGRCEVVSPTFNKKASRTTFSVSLITHATLAYDPAANLETSIGVTKP